MLDKAVERVQTLAMPNVILKVMDATSLSFGDNEFDKVVATYTISAVPDPVAVLREMRRVVKPGGILVILNHFRSERRLTGWVEDMLAPVCTRLGWKSNLPLAPLLVPGASVDLYARAGTSRGAALVLVHGFSPAGKDDPRVREAAALLSRAGFDVAVPTIPGLTRGELGSDDVEPVVATLAVRTEPSVVVGVSVGSGPALLAAADPRVGDRVRAVLSLGGYASASEVVRFWLTGAYGFDGLGGRVDHDPELVRMFVRANGDRLDPPSRALLEGGGPEGAARLLAAPPAELQRYLDALSPIRVARDIRARLILVHGRDDRAVPYTESLRLAAARPERTRLVLVGVVDHV